MIATTRDTKGTNMKSDQHRGFQRDARLAMLEEFEIARLEDRSADEIQRRQAE